ncbi:aminotransferase [Rhodopseudomonas palustris]|uniref:Aminotransferase n=1 Tax=Rhodopseudomonas palustris TaxID=1076 RepID=A0AAX3DS37_RHOPL|nr:aminotransferase [Rhodopseudomonas palustris]UYO37640.1 aminotransferase [Rhodopseudomonas palustris]
MHICPPPRAAIAAWLKETNNINGNYGHLLLEQQAPIDPAQLRPYFESAHLDAREVFHGDAGLDLHPDATAPGAHAQYPACLPPKARRGLFGEVLCGLVTEQYEFVGKRKWIVPVFLFRHHADARKYVFALARDPARQRQLHGRHGNDFIAICLDDDGAVVRFLTGEAKWRKSLTSGQVETLMFGKWETHNGVRARSNRGIWFELNRELAAPDGLRQLQAILKERDPTGYAAAIFSMDQVLVLRNPVVIPRTDLVVLSGNAAAARSAGSTLLPVSAAPADYTAGNPLQIVEVILEGGDALIDQLYDSLWS